MTHDPGQGRALPSSVFDPPRGTRDLLPSEMRRVEHVLETVRGALDAAGYQPVRTPAYERFSLLAARAGDAVRQSMFTFTSERIEYALRPEMTAPVCRLVAGGRLGPGPVHRLRYAGPCFRYERAGSRRSREFTQAGAELFGVAGLQGDLEIISVAARCLQMLGLRLVVLRVADIRVFGAAVAHLAEGARAVAAGLLDDLLAVEARCREQAATSAAPDDSGGLREAAALVYRLQRRLAMPERELLQPPATYDSQTVAELTPALGPAMRTATREALVRLAGMAPDSAAALVEAAGVSGPAPEVAATGLELLGPESEEAIVALVGLCDACSRAGVEGLEACLGVARGFEFYTGTVLEIADRGLAAEPTLGGGGRYDRLVEELGGPPTPAVGFALDVEQVASALQAHAGVDE